MIIIKNYIKDMLLCSVVEDMGDTMVHFYGGLSQ
jgi:hypothetical protein